MRQGRGWHLGLGPEIGRVFWAMLFVEAAFGAYMAVWPIWIETLGASVPTVGLVLGSSGLLRLGALIPAARIAERFGTRRTIVTVRVAAGLGMLAAAAATDWTQLFAMVIGASIGEAAFPLAQYYVISRAGADRVRAFSLVFTVGPSVAFGLSPLLSGALVAVWGIRAAFLLAAAFTAASIACFAGLALDPHPVHAAGTARSTYRDALGDGRARRILALQFTTIFVLALGTSFVPTFLKDERGYAPSIVTLVGAGAAIGTAGFGLAVARSVRLQRLPFVTIAVAVGAVGIALVTFALTGAVGIVAAAYVLRGGFFSAWVLFVTALGEVVVPEHRARAFATSEMLGGAAFAFAPAAAGLLYARDPTLPLLVSVALAAVLIPTLLRTQRLLYHPPVLAQSVSPDGRLLSPEP